MMKAKTSKPVSEAKFPAIHPGSLARLNRNLEKADDIAEPQRAALWALAHVEVFLGHVSIKSVALKRLSNALSDHYYHGRKNELLALRGFSRRDVPRVRAAQAWSAAAAYFLWMAGYTYSQAYSEVASVWNKAGIPSTKAGKKVNAKTIGGWREKFMRLRKASEETKRGDREDVEIFDQALRKFFPDSLHLLMGEKPNKRDAKRVLSGLSAALESLFN